MTDNPTYKEIVAKMLQACKNIIYATSNLNAPEDIEKDTYALENTDICLSIILDAKNSIPEDELGALNVIDWTKIEHIIQLLHKQNKTDEDYNQGIYSYKNDLPKLREKLETCLAQMS